MTDEFPFISDLPEEPKPTPVFEPPMLQTSPFVEAPPRSIEEKTTPPDSGSALADFEDDSDEADFRKIGLIVGGLVVLFVVMIVGVGYYFAHDIKETDATQNLEVTSDAGGEKQVFTRNLVSAKDGGRVVSEYGAEVVVPAGALAQDTEIKIERVALGEVTDLFHLLPDGLRFLKPVTLKIPYKKDALKSQSLATIILGYWSVPGEGNTFSKSLDYEVDGENGKLLTEVIEF